jgi:hypothetical protein
MLQLAVHECLGHGIVTWLVGARLHWLHLNVIGGVVEFSGENWLWQRLVILAGGSLLTLLVATAAWVVALRLPPGLGRLLLWIFALTAVQDELAAVFVLPAAGFWMGRPMGDWSAIHQMLGSNPGWLFALGVPLLALVLMRAAPVTQEVANWLLHRRIGPVTSAVVLFFPGTFAIWVYAVATLPWLSGHELAMLEHHLTRVPMIAAGAALYVLLRQQREGPRLGQARPTIPAGVLAALTSAAIACILVFGPTLRTSSGLLAAFGILTPPR